MKLQDLQYNLVEALAESANGSDVGGEGKQNQGWPLGFDLSNWMGGHVI